MSFLRLVAKFLQVSDYPSELRDANSELWVRFHQSTIAAKPAFRSVLVDIQDQILEIVLPISRSLNSSPILEIGAGVIPLSDQHPQVISSEYHFTDQIDVQLSAYSLPFPEASLSAIIAQNVFHHLFDFKVALAELTKTLKPGGSLILIEPYFGFLSRVVYPLLFDSENFDLTSDPEKYKDELIANQALSGIIFSSRQSEFLECFPELEIIETKPLRSGIRYLASGGLNFRRILPLWLFRVLSAIEHSRFGFVFQGHLSLHWMIVIRKKYTATSAKDA